MSRDLSLLLRSGSNALSAFNGRLQLLRAHPMLSGLAVAEAGREWAGGHPAQAEHLPHLLQAVEWLVRAQEATPDGGLSRGYSLTWNPYFGAPGWQPSYPETTGYTLPTLYQAAHQLSRPDLRERATRAAHWEVEVQLPSGAVRGGVMGQTDTPAVFNTGQVILGWLSAHQETGDGRFAEAARRASRYLCEVMDPDGHWRRGNSRFARGDSTLYNARAAWALAEAGARLDEPTFSAAAARNLHAVVKLQHANGWLPACCLNDPGRPLLHTLAYTVRGLLEGGRVLGDERLVGAAARAAERLAAAVQPNGFLPGRFHADWSPAAAWSCLTGQAQICNSWIRLFEITGEERWLRPVPAVLRFVKSTQNRTSADPGLRGGIKGSAPVGGDYGRYEVLSWATKFFADALMRDDRVHGRAAAGAGVAFDLA